VPRWPGGGQIAACVHPPRCSPSLAC
jgi:hypothetical protein